MEEINNFIERSNYKGFELNSITLHNCKKKLFLGKSKHKGLKLYFANLQSEKEMIISKK